MSRAAVRLLATWRYPPPYNYYDLTDDPLQVARLLAGPQSAYFQVCDAEGILVAFGCFGEEAQMPGGAYAADALDVGLGVRPDCTGRGEGLRYLTAILGFANERFGSGPRRLTVARFNARAIRLYHKAGFRPIQEFTATFSGRPFVVLWRDE